MKIEQPPSSITGPLFQYLQQLASVVNAMPQFSYFNTASPEGTVFGSAGDFAMSLASTSTFTRLWVKASSPGAVSAVSWVRVRILP